MSCTENEPSVIKKDTYYDTIKKGDSNEVEREIVLPEDNTSVKDSAIEF